MIGNSAVSGTVVGRRRLAPPGVKIFRPVVLYDPVGATTGSAHAVGTPAAADHRGRTGSH